MIIPPLADLESYGISPASGFLSSDPPLRRLPASLYDPWEDVVENLSALISSQRIYETIQTLPLIPTNHLLTQLEWQRAYVVLGFLVHAYVWGADRPTVDVPVQLSEPYLQVCSHLGMEPVISHAGLCLWNWCCETKEKPLDIRAMDCLTTFTGTRDEAVFYLSSVAIEGAGGSTIPHLLAAVWHVQRDAPADVAEMLRLSTEGLNEMQKPFSCLYRDVKPGVFFHQIRPFLAGGGGLPEGMVFQRKDGTALKVKSAGGSAGQSSLFQFLDLVLGVQHQTGTKELLEVRRASLLPDYLEDELIVWQDMRRYMPGRHRQFLEVVSKLPNIGQYVKSRTNEFELQEAYGACLKSLRTWRSKHLAVVSTYIVRPSRGVEERCKLNNDEVSLEPVGFDDELKGTGGSSLIPFLKQSRDETAAR